MKDADSISREADRIFAEVEKRKNQARLLGLDKFVIRFYFREIGLLDDNNNLNTEKREIIFSIVKVIIDSGHVKNKDGYVIDEFEYANNKYTFSFDSNNLLLLFNDKLAISLFTDIVKQENGRFDWEVLDIKGFIEGDWIQGLKKLQTEIENAQPKVEALKKMNMALKKKSEADALKENFGIDSNTK